MMAAISPPPLTPQDRSRIHRAEIRKATSDPDAESRVDAAIAWARRSSLAFRARALVHHRVFSGSLAIYRRELIGAGCDGRQADLLSTLLAGREMLLYDDLPIPDMVDDMVERVRGHIGLMRAADEDDGDAQQCLSHLLSASPDHWRSGARVTLGLMIAAARGEPYCEGDSGKALRMYGLRLDPFGTDAPALLVANRHNGLAKIFFGTKWAGGGWQDSLRRLGPDVGPHDRPERFAGPVSRCLRVPARFLPNQDEDARRPDPREVKSEDDAHDL